jgi:hypothetical protein
VVELARVLDAGIMINQVKPEEVSLLRKSRKK